MNKKLIVIFSLLFLLLMITNVSAKDTNMTGELSTTDIDVDVNGANEVNMADELSVMDVVEKNVDSDGGVLKTNDDSSYLLQSSNDNEKLGASSTEVNTFSELSDAIENRLITEIIVFLEKFIPYEVHI